MKILDIIYKCSENLNKQLPEEGRLTLSKATPIIGDNSVLDSLGIVMLVVSVEEAVARQGIDCSLVDVLTSETGNPPFTTMGDLAEWIEKRRL
tara:strand:+ start:10346 stop:10624 length:279 start_codon:yes stop_codon:yes gene_type:complete